MASINIKRFVDIDIIKHETSNVVSTRDTVVLFTSEIASTFDETFSSFAEYVENSTTNAATNTKLYAQIYFTNGGNKLRVIKDANSSNSLATAISNLENEYIVIAFCGGASENYTVMQPIAATRNANTNIYGINEKILLARTETTNSLTTTKNLAVKYSTIVGAEMTIAAYLSNLDVYGLNTVNDYAFTKETITATDGDDDLLGTILTNNLNVDMYLAGSVRNLGGNMSNGDDLINKYTLIILHQTVTERVLNLLSQKIKGATALSSLYSVISQELSRYVTCGYLTTDKTWTEPTLSISYNNQNYVVITQGTSLLLGYKITILPLSSLTAEDKALHKAPLIYILLADSYGIRKVTINGEVR